MHGTSSERHHDSKYHTCKPKIASKLRGVTVGRCEMQWKPIISGVLRLGGRGQMGLRAQGYE